jgi:hypothetical protein
VLTFTVPRESLEAVAGGHPQVLQALHGVEHQELAESRAQHVCGEPPRRNPIEEPLRFSVSKAPNHRYTI